MNESAAWLEYFRGNAGRPSPAVGPGCEEIAPRLRAALVRSLGRFYLGESGEGRVAHEAAQSGDPALDADLCECIALYVREEGRHGRELAGALTALGAELPARHWSEALFRRGRRLLGLRTKMMTIAAAEVVGVAYYEMLRDRVAPLAAVAGVIAAEERRHLELQAAYFARVAEAIGAGGAGQGEAGEAGARRRPYRWAGEAAFAGIVGCAVVTFVIDHAPLLTALGVRRSQIVGACAREAGRAIGLSRVAHLARRGPAGYPSAVHESGGRLGRPARRVPSAAVGA